MHLHHDSWGRLILTDAAGHEHSGVTVVRAFPMSAPRHGVSILGSDGHELAWIDDLDTLPPGERQAIEDALNRREFLPQLRRIVSVSGSVEPTEWEVETDRGATRFILNSDDDVRPLKGNRAVIVDSNGVRYLIADVDTLDAPSRGILERYL